MRDLALSTFQSEPANFHTHTHPKIDIKLDDDQGRPHRAFVFAVFKILYFPRFLQPNMKEQNEHLRGWFCGEKASHNSVQPIEPDPNNCRRWWACVGDVGLLFCFFLLSNTIARGLWTVSLWVCFSGYGGRVKLGVSKL